jgi:hypothetical protein
VDTEKQFVEVRFIVLVLIDITHQDFIDTLRASESKHVGDAVSSEMISNLESVSYVESVIVSQL